MWSPTTVSSATVSVSAAANRLRFCSDIYLSDELIEVNLDFRFVPSPLIEPRIASDMPAAIRPYSMAVAPLSSSTNFNNIRFILKSFPVVELGIDFAASNQSQIGRWIVSPVERVNIGGKIDRALPAAMTNGGKPWRYKIATPKQQDRRFAALADNPDKRRNFCASWWIAI